MTVVRAELVRGHRPVVVSEARRLGSPPFCLHVLGQTKYESESDKLLYIYMASHIYIYIYVLIFLRLPSLTFYLQGKPKGDPSFILMVPQGKPDRFDVPQVFSDFLSFCFSPGGKGSLGGSRAESR